MPTPSARSPWHSTRRTSPPSAASASASACSPPRSPQRRAAPRAPRTILTKGK
ncbi:hypothetical protein LV779_21860 [Streptomyces thinghirensis]|nr:hypothetical protein [Streptomyces thinghirensis]